MPDEAVIITAEFSYNPYYFELKQKIIECESISFDNYSRDSFANLQIEINEAKNSLNNHISEE